MAGTADPTMTPYTIEFVLALLGWVGAWLVVHELVLYGGRRAADRFLVLFFVAFSIAPIWFMVANFMLIARGDPDWLLNRWISFAVRVPLVGALYAVYWTLRSRRPDDLNGFR